MRDGCGTKNSLIDVRELISWGGIDLEWRDGGGGRLTEHDFPFGTMMSKKTCTFSEVSYTTETACTVTADISW